METISAASLDALIEAFRRHSSYQLLMKRTPGLGTAVPWTAVTCSDGSGDATGLVVGGQCEDGVWDLSGTFILFSTDHSPAGEILSVNGWCGEVLRLSAQGTDAGRLDTPDWDELFSNPDLLTRRLRAALDASPYRWDVFVRSPLLGVVLPWVVVRLIEEPGEPLGLVLGGDSVVHQSAGRLWNLDKRFRVLVAPRGGEAEIREIDPARQRVSVECVVAPDEHNEENPNPIAVLNEMTAALHAWARREDLVAAWTRHAAVVGLPPSPSRFLEVRYGQEVYRGLQIVNSDEPMQDDSFDDLVTLLLPTGTVMVLDLAQADRVVEVHRGDGQVE